MQSAAVMKRHGSPTNQQPRAAQHRTKAYAQARTPQVEATAQTLVADHQRWLLTG